LRRGVWECLGLAGRLARIVAGHALGRGCDCILLSGGVDTSFIALAAARAGLRVRVLTLAAPGSPDYPYAVEAAEALGLDLIPARPTPAEYVEAVDFALSSLAVADPVEVAGAAAAALGLAAARAAGCGCVLTGDGGDELFLGYTFLLHAPPERLGEWRARMAGGGARFAVEQVASRLRARVCHPLYSPEARRLSLEAPLGCLIGRGPGGRLYGKLLMRLYLDASGLRRLAWRDKTPVTSGSGALEALEAIAEGREPVEGWEPSSAHAYLLARMKLLGIHYPAPCTDPQRRCPVCGRCLEGQRCPFCGAHLENGTVSVYTGPQTP
jgi:asparagine synthase (glutamine-hydrolysing)